MVVDQPLLWHEAPVVKVNLIAELREQSPELSNQLQSENGLTTSEVAIISTSGLTRILLCYPFASAMVQYLTKRDVACLAFTSKAVYNVLHSQGFGVLMKLSVGCSVNCTQVDLEPYLQTISRTFHKCFFCAQRVCVC
jgi:hypothetical protein